LRENILKQVRSIKGLVSADGNSGDRYRNRARQQLAYRQLQLQR